MLLAIKIKNVSEKKTTGAKLASKAVSISLNRYKMMMKMRLKLTSSSENTRQKSIS